MSEQITTWRVGYTLGGALGVWSSGCHTDDPDVCLVALVPGPEDVIRAALIAAAPSLKAECQKIEHREARRRDVLTGYLVDEIVLLREELNTANRGIALQNDEIVRLQDAK